ncbi:MAG: helix-turn-helix domain-containing protein [Acidimicrobiales bacterium]
MVEADHGAEVAQSVARHLVLFLRRPGGQSQFATPVWSDPVGRVGIRAAQELVHEDPSADLTVRALARAAGMSERHFTRVFAEEIGCSPARYVERLRIEAARNVLERSDDGLDTVARRCGFGSAETLRRAFLRQVGVTPGAYRDRFRLDSSAT